MLQWLCNILDLPMLVERADGVVEANAAARQRMAGRDSGNLVACVGDVVGPELDTARVSHLVEHARSGTEGEMASSDGERLLLSQAGPGRAVVVVAPEALATNASLRRRAAIADHSAGVSHELANALGAIAGWAHLARQGERVDEALELIEKAAESARSTARHMLNGVSRDDQSSPEVIDLSGFVADAARLLGPKAMRHDVKVRSSVASDISVRADRGSLWSIVWNLATNAVEAMPSGGVVELELVPADNNAILTVNDNGPGMPLQVRERVFEPYFTTKGSGTGLGLAMVRKAVHGLGGQIKLHSAPGRGTSFQVVLPMAQQPSLSERPGNGKHASGVFRTEPLAGRFLVVEDDAALREMVATALQMRGAEVVAVADAQGAREQSGPFAAAIVDLLLPDGRGDHLITELREANVVARALLATGTELPDNIPAGGTPDAVLRDVVLEDERDSAVSH